MNTPLDRLAKELEEEIEKIHKMSIDIPEELWIKEKMVADVHKRAKKIYEDHFADLDDTKLCEIIR